MHGGRTAMKLMLALIAIGLLLSACTRRLQSDNGSYIYQGYEYDSIQGGLHFGYGGENGFGHGPGLRG